VKQDYNPIPAVKKEALRPPCFVIGKTSHARRRRLLRYLGGMGWQHIGDARNGKGTNPDLS
jgi:hypothetical protein